MNCIEIKNKSNCCGCGACADICPKSCIQMRYDADGFLYPAVDGDLCVLCGRCKRVCPVLGADTVKNTTDDAVAYAYVASNDEFVRSSTSGGAFSLIMDAISEIGGEFAIIGAVMDGTKVRHTAFHNRKAADALRKSKYVQSLTTGIFREVAQMLKKNTRVLFSGTPCQVAALKRYLGYDDANLLTVDIVCHGVPSQTLFDEYVKETETQHNAKVIWAQFRYKRDFDKKNTNSRALKLFFDNGSCVDYTMAESEFLYAYYTGLLYRPSCRACRFACSSRPGDITLGDYWGIEKMYPNLNSLRGVSLLHFNTEKGKFLMPYFEESGILKKTDWKFACAENNQLTHPAVPHRNQNKFFKQRLRGIGFCENVRICKKPDTVLQKILRKLQLLLFKKS